MLTKDQVLESIRIMPEERFDDIDVLLERLVMLEKIYTGVDQANKGHVISFEDVMKEIEQW